VEGARTYLERLRWPDGLRCPRCDAASVLQIRTRRKYYCSSCWYQFRVTAGTRLHDSHVPGWKWLVAIDFMMSELAPVSAVQLKGLLGGSYRTSWFLEHRIREALILHTSDEGSMPGKHPRYGAAYAAEARWRASGGTRATRFRQAVMALLEAEPLGYRELVSRPA